MASTSRRAFLVTSTATAAGLSALSARSAADQPNERLVLAVMGVRGRGRELLRDFSACPDVEIAYLCDPDDNVVPAALRAIHPRQPRPPRHERDVRRVLEDRHAIWGTSPGVSPGRLRFDAATQTCTSDAEANRLLRREYRRPFTASVLEAGT
jgi:hypothetical protein